MEKLEQMMYYFIKEFPQKLGRTSLIKAIYLLDCEWYKSFGETYSGMEYKRDKNGPFNATFYDAKSSLCEMGLIYENPYIYSGGGGRGFEFYLLKEDPELENKINPVAKCIADEIVEKLSYKDLNSFLGFAYNTEPMLEILQVEDSGSKQIGRVLNMSRIKDPQGPKPLFNFEEIRKIAGTLDMENRGSDEDYNKTVIEEMNELSIFRERVEKVCQVIEEA
ncbi:hypothetical protein D1B31_22035 [Neobacillus notoginsengisoli]|uniref:DUF4065 domain-containing protein n=1 Tax=Neobacillus notoginsengisoli TaxID=1578198 RepID=A0A417YFE8_9BACI|nr:hypothetical protein [Neobacillus notoginsengisoli]RHW31489.1 hypothetical protein D1B31_22035 [Neobacillus notoginsengisoli]